MEGKKQKFAIVITVFVLGILTTFHISHALGSGGTVRNIKAVVDGLPGETDLQDNMKEKEVSISSCGFTDIAVTDITLSPKFIVDSDTVTVSVRVKNKGNETARGIELVLSQLGMSEDSNAKIFVVEIKRIEEIKPGKEVKKDFSLWVEAPVNDGYNILLGAEVPILEGDSEPWDNSMCKEFSIEREDGTISIVHKKFIHQYVCVEAAKIFGQNLFGGGGSEGRNYLFTGDHWRGKHEGYTICGGAWDEDERDLVYGDIPFSVTLTHFWDADRGDDAGSWLFGFPGLKDLPNTYQRAVAFWRGRHGEHRTVKSIVDLYGEDKSEAYKHLGHISHLLADMGVPAHAHVDPHVDPQNVIEFAVSLFTGDDCYEDWMGKEGYDNWSYRGALNAGGLIHIPWDKRPADVSKDIFPLYYLMYTTNQYADYFASDDRNGDSYDRRGWLDYSGWPGSPRKAKHLDPNPLRIFPPWDRKGDNDWGDDDDDGDLTRIGNKAYVYTIRATVTLYKLFWESVHPEKPPIYIYDSSWHYNSVSFKLHKPVSFQLTEPVKVDIKLYDPDGKLVKVVVKEQICNAGQNYISWTIQPEEIPQGVFKYVLETSDSMKVHSNTVEVGPADLALEFCGVSLFSLDGMSLLNNSLLDIQKPTIMVEGRLFGYSPDRVMAKLVCTAEEPVDLGPDAGGSFKLEHKLVASGKNNIVLYARNAVKDVAVNEHIVYRVGVSYPANNCNISGIPTNVTIQGNADTSNFQNFSVEFGTGTSPIKWNTIRQSSTKVLGPLMGTLSDWDVGRLNGYYTMRCKINGQEVNRSTFIVGQKIAPDKDGLAVDPINMVSLSFEPLTFDTTQYITISPLALNQDVVIPKIVSPEVSYLQPIGPIYEIKPGELKSEDFNKKPMLTIKYSDEDIDIDLVGDGVPRKELVKKNLGIYRWDNKGQNLSLVPAVDTVSDADNNTISTRIDDFSYDYLILPANEPPKISSFYCSPFIFNPVLPQEFRKQTTNYATVTTNSAKYVWVSIDVKNKQGEVVAKLADRKLENMEFVEDDKVLRKALSYSWDGKDDNGAVVPDGVYTIQMEVQDGVGNLSQSDCLVVKGRVPPEIALLNGQSTADNLLPDASNPILVSGLVEITGSAVDPAGFSGYSVAYAFHGTEDWNRIAVPASYVNGPVYTVSSMQITDGLLAVWDTTKVADGSYDLKLTINDESGSTDSVTVYNIVVQNGLDIYNFTALPNPFALSTTISYTLENPADVTVEVLDAVSLTLVKTLVDNETQTAGTHTTTWDGEGAIADIGDYICKISAPRAKAPGPITIRRIANNSNIRARIDFPDTGLVASTIAIMGEAGNSIDSDFASYSVDFSVRGSSLWTPIFSNARPVQPSGILVSSWDTREMVNGDYILRLTVSDKAGNSKAVTKEITVANEVTLVAVPSVITPNAPDGIKTTTITYSLPKPVSSTDLGIYLGSTLVKTFTTFTAQGTYSLTWDGTDDNFSPVPSGQYNCVLIADGETKSAVITVDRGTSVIGAEIKLDNSEPVFGKPYFDWAAYGSGQYDIAQHFNWKVTASGTESWIARLTKSGSKTGSYWGAKETGVWRIAVRRSDGGYDIFFYTERAWIGINISYGVIFDSIPNPSISVSYMGSKLEIYDKTRSGCKARVWTYRNIYNRYGTRYIGEWYWAPSEFSFSWSVSGDVIRSAEVSNSTALRSGTAYAHSPHQTTYSVTVNPQHGGTVDPTTGNASVSDSNPDVQTSISKNSQASGRSIVVSGDLTGTVPQEPQFEGNWSAGEVANPLFKRDNFVSYNTPLTFSIFSSLSYYTPPFELDKAPHCSQWTVFGSYYPETTATNPDVIFTDIYGTPAASPLNIGDGSTFVIGDFGTENKGQDQFIAKLKVPYEGRTFIKIPGIASTGNFERYRIEFGAGSTPQVWQTVKESTIPIPEGTLGYWDVTRLNGEYTLLLTVYDVGGIAAGASQKTFQIGQPITSSGGQVQDAYGTVTVDFPSGSLITDKVVTISPVKSEEIKIFNKDFQPFGPIYEFQSYPGNLNEDDFARDSDGDIIKPATLTFKGTASELGIAPEDESKIGIYSFDPLTQEIQLIPCVIIKDASGLFTISAKITHFCYYFLAKDTLPPQFTIYVSPDPVSGGKVNIKVNSSKTLDGPPSVKVLTPDGQTQSVNMARDSSVEGVNSYTGTFLLPAEEMKGTAEVSVTGKDLAGNQGSATARFTIDTSLPVFNVDAIPDPAGVGEITLRIYSTRRLARAPTVTVTPFGKETQIVNISGSDCRYTGIFSVKQGMDGTALVEIVGETETGKKVSGSGTFEIITTNPELSVSVTPDIANGEVNINVTSSRKLAGLPTVMVKPYGQAPLSVEMSVVSESDHIYKGKFIVVPGSIANGEALATVSALDEAGNVGETSTTFIVDTIPPGLTVSVSPRRISSGEVAISIIASEPLDQSPNVTVAQKGNTPVSVNVVKEGELTYSSTYTIDENFPGIAVINVSAKDLAGNIATATESFVVDTESPVLTVSAIPNSCSLGEIKIIVSSLKELRNPPEVSVVFPGEIQSQIISMTKLSFSSKRTHLVEQYQGTFIIDRNTPEGVATINVSGIDIAGNSSQTFGNFDIDHTAPKFEVLANPALSRAGTVTISVVASEPVKALPRVVVSEQSGENLQSIELVTSPNFSEVLDTGIVTIDNSRLCLKIFGPGEVVTFPFDNTYKKKPIKIGENLYKISGVSEHWTEKLEVEVVASIVDEKGSPIVDFSSAGIKSGDPWTIYGLANMYTGKYEVTEGKTPNGEKTISVSATDFAGNEGWGRGTFRTDTAPPAFSISISPNPARTGKVNILVTAPKKLKRPPEVKVTPFTQSGQKVEMKDAPGAGKPIATGNVIAIKSAETDDFPVSYLVMKLYNFDELITFPLDGSWDRKLVKVKNSFYRLAYLAQGFSEEGLVEIGCVLADGDGQLVTDLTASGIEQNDPWTVYNHDYSGIFVVDPYAICNGVAKIEVSGIDEAGNKATAFGEFIITGGYDNPLGLISKKVVNYPNPFHAGREDTTIQYYLNKSANVKMRIYDLFGNLVRTLDFSPGEEGGRMGRNRVAWDGRNGRGIVVANGGYICRVEAKAGKERKVRIRKIGVLK
ncbi:hypothetical protein ES705_02404 [subsurface metagenome]|nr:hypothetical protein [Clostridia bacterium]